MGRRSKLTPDVQKAVCDALGVGATVEIACGYAGIAETTYYGWIEKGASRAGAYREFREATQKALNRCAIQDLATISKAANAGSWQASAWRLERRHGFVKTERREQTGPGGGPIQTTTCVNLAGLSLEQLAALGGNEPPDMNEE